MKRLVSNRLAQKIQTQVANTFGDKGTLLHDTVGSLDSYGQPSSPTTSSTVLTCSFTDKPKAENWKEYADIEQIDAEVRFEASTAPVRGDRFTITQRFDDSTYTDVTFDIVDIRDRGVFGFVCALKKVQV